MATDVGNQTDTESLAHLNVMLSVISGNLAAYPPLTAADVTATGSLRDDFDDKLLTHNTSQAQATADTESKNVVRKAVDAEKRRIKALLKAHGVSEADMNALGYPSGGPAGESVSAATRPIATIDNSERLRQTVHFADVSAPNIKRRPKGVVGAEIFLKIDGPPPGNETECNFLALDTATPYTVEFQPSDAGKTAWYLIRWLFKDGTRSAFAETVSATITG